MRRRHWITATIATALCLTAISATTAAAGEARVEGSFTAEATPLPVPWVISDQGCMDGPEGTGRVTEKLRAPFSGWLRVTADFQGDWELALFRGEKELAWSTHQENTEEPVEKISYFIRAGDAVDIAVCNLASPSPAEVRYVLTAGAPWEAAAGRTLRTHEERLSYRSPAVATHDHWGICHMGFEIGCSATTDIHPTDRFVYVQTHDVGADAIARPGHTVSAEIYQYAGNTYLGDDTFCTRTDRAIALKPGVDLVGVAIFLGPCSNGDPAAGTAGDVTLTFSNIKK